MTKSNQELIGMRDPKPPIEQRVTQALLALTDAVGEAEAANLPATLGAIADATRAFKRLASRGRPLPVSSERVEVEQTRGPRLEFTGHLLGKADWQTRGNAPLSVTIDLWETPAGALVAVNYTEPAERQGFVSCEALVIEPQGDEQARRFAVMDFFRWEDRARSMVKKLGWSLRREVD